MHEKKRLPYLLYVVRIFRQLFLAQLTILHTVLNPVTVIGATGFLIKVT